MQKRRRITIQKNLGYTQKGTTSNISHMTWHEMFYSCRHTMYHTTQTQKKHFLANFACNFILLIFDELPFTYRARVLYELRNGNRRGFLYIESVSISNAFDFSFSFAPIYMRAGAYIYIYALDQNLFSLFFKYLSVCADVMMWQWQDCIGSWIIIPSGSNGV